MDRKQIAALLVVLVVGIGVVLFAMNRGEENGAATETTAVPVASAEPADTIEQTEIRYTDSGFTPATLTVAMNQTITVTNDSDRTIEFSSDPHPTHTEFPALNLGSIAPGASKTVTISRSGTFGYHDHLRPSDQGTIVVQ